MIRTLTSGLLLCAFVAVAPASACEFHGGALWTPSHSWQNFTPRESFVDPIFGDPEEELFQIQLEEPPQKARPSFSKAASEASRKAKSRIKLANHKVVEKKETEKDTLLGETARYNTSLDNASDASR